MNPPKEKPKPKQPNHFSVSLSDKDLRRLYKIMGRMAQEDDHRGRLTRGTAARYAIRKYAEAIGE